MIEFRDEQGSLWRIREDEAELGCMIDKHLSSEDPDAEDSPERYLIVPQGAVRRLGVALIHYAEQLEAEGGGS